MDEDRTFAVYLTSPTPCPRELLITGMSIRSHVATVLQRDRPDLLHLREARCREALLASGAMARSPAKHPTE